MSLSQKIITARKRKGLTQEQLAEEAKITVRTIQRIEAGETVPRPFTLKAIAIALDIPFETLIAEEVIPVTANKNTLRDDKHFLQMLCLSCFCYLVIPLVHFLIPHYISRKRKDQNVLVSDLGRNIVRKQLYWVICLHLSLFVTLAYNFIVLTCFNKPYPVSYLWPFFIMYFLNVVIILRSLRQVKAEALI